MRMVTVPRPSTTPAAVKPARPRFMGFFEDTRRGRAETVKWDPFAHRRSHNDAEAPRMTGEGSLTRPIRRRNTPRLTSLCAVTSQGGFVAYYRVSTRKQG